MSHRTVETRRKASSGAVLVWVLLILALLLSCGGIGDEAKYSVSGRVTSAGSALPGVTMTLSGNGSGTTITDANGNYGFGDLEWGTYTVTPTLAGYQFMPAFRNVYLQGINGEGFNFNAGRPIQVSTSSHTLFQKSNGTVWAWGNNASGQLGDGSTIDRYSPVAVLGLTGVTAVSAGGAHSLALKSDGTVWAWGSNTSGQLGDGSTTDRLAPVQVGGLSGVTAIAAGTDFSMALKNDGTVWTWGNGTSGQLGNGAFASSASPVRAGDLTAIASIAAGHDHALAMNTGNASWVWGGNSRGQLCIGNTTNYSSPVRIGILVTAISAGTQFTVALVRDSLNGDVYACGANGSGQLGNGSTADSWSAVKIAMGSLNIAAVAAGTDHVLALNIDGTAWAWGNNSAGELGNGTAINSSVPVQVSGLAAVQGIDAGYRNSFAETSSNAIFAWGNNSDGQLGDTTTTNRWIPEQITLP
jgi:alpha-tubulin suppressor-like RCC1 family protein